MTDPGLISVFAICKAVMEKPAIQKDMKNTIIVQPMIDPIKKSQTALGSKCFIFIL
jgi:hypothetical protein